MLAGSPAERLVMSRLHFMCLFLSYGLTASAVSAAPIPQKAQPALIVVEEVPNPSGVVDKRRLLRIGVRDGKLLPAETIWQGDQRFLGHFGGHKLVKDRFLITGFGGVIDLRDKKVLHNEEDGKLCAIEGTKVFFRLNNIRRDEGVFYFDLNTRKVHKEVGFGEDKYALWNGVRSPDGMVSVECGPFADELILHQVAAKPKSLGKGFHVDVSNLSSSFGPTPVLWLNPGVILTQKGNGKLVTVDVTGKVTELLTIKDAPIDLVGPPSFFRDGSNRIVYACGSVAFAVDVEKKTAVKYEWHDLGHGFEVSWQPQDKSSYKLRHNGKEIGSLICWPHTAKTAPGLLALEAQSAKKGLQVDCVAVWSVEVGKWQTLKLWPNSVVGWVK